jgi:uncharacterized protein (DUF4415 family)
MRKTAFVRFDPAQPLTDKEKAQITALAEKADDPVDVSDIPELDERFWATAVRNPFYKPRKASTTVRIDKDVLEWLRAQGRGYQTRINQILREAMLKGR